MDADQGPGGLLPVHIQVKMMPEMGKIMVLRFIEFSLRKRGSLSSELTKIMKMLKMVLKTIKMTETTISLINRGGNPLPTVTGFLDDVEQLDVDTVQVDDHSLHLEIYISAQFRMRRMAGGRWRRSTPSYQAGHLSCLVAIYQMLSCCYLSNVFLLLFIKCFCQSSAY